MIQRIDPQGCDCPDCQEGISVPLDDAEPEQLCLAVEGAIRNTSGQRIYASPDSYADPEPYQYHQLRGGGEARVNQDGEPY